MRNREEKLHFERQVFTFFCETASLVIDSDQIFQPDPPLPDIHCSIAGQQRFFELTLLTDHEIEAKISEASNFRKRKEGKRTCSNFKITIDDVVSLIQKKAKKSYAVNEVELLIHDGGTPIDDLWIYDQEFIGLEIQNATNSSSFARVWIFDNLSSKVLSFDNQIVQRVIGG